VVLFGPLNQLNLKHMITETINALFHDEEGCRELVAIGRYAPADEGGWQDGKRSEPPTSASMELDDILTPEGGSVYVEELRDSALKALWDEVEDYEVEDYD